MHAKMLVTVIVAPSSAQEEGSIWYVVSSPKAYLAKN
jgi:hypothetical protein